MTEERDLDSLAETSLMVDRAASKHGTSEMQTPMRVTLLKVVQEIAAASEREGSGFKDKAAREEMSAPA